VVTPEGVRTISYLVHDGHAIHEGDIDLGTLEHVRELQQLRGGAVSFGNLWPYSRVFFRFGSTFDGQVCQTGMTNCTDIRTLVRTTLTAMAQKLPVTFVEDTSNTATNYVKLDWAPASSNFGGSSNSVGMAGGEQTIVFPIGHVADTSLPQEIPYNIQPNAPTLRHEMLHAIGLWHEQSRSDRNAFVTINTGCIQSSQLSQFDIASDTINVGPYDFASIMHYSAAAFCIPWQFATPDPDGDGCACPSMTAITPGAVIGGGPILAGFSIEDTNTLYRMYTRSGISDAAGDHYGQAVAIGDFDADGYDDLAVGIPNEDVVLSVLPVFTTSSNAGRVALYKGTSTGLVLWNTLTERDFAGTVTANGHFGTALVALDLDADGITDLAVGAPGANGNSGAVFTYLGNVNGIPASDRMLTQQTAGYTDEAGDRFGETLAAGPITGQTRLDSCNTAFNGTAYDALVIGAPSDRNAVPFTGNTVRSGAVYIFQDVVNCGDQLAHATRLWFVRGGTGDDFGAALAVGKLDTDNKADLAVGAPHRNANAGAVYTYTGRLPTESPILWSSMVTSVTSLNGGTSEQYGSALAIGDIASAYSGNELVVGAPGLTGSVKVLAGGANPLLVQTLFNFPTATGDRFGAALAIGNVDATTASPDLVVGIPGQDSGAGAIAILRGGALTPRTKVRQSDLSPMFDNAANDGFGSSLAIGQLDGRGPVPSTASTIPKLLDLAIGGPGEAPDLVPFGQGPAGSGAVSLMKGATATVVAPWQQFTQAFDGHL
jgi:hypothetical protein